MRTVVLIGLLIAAIAALVAIALVTQPLVAPIRSTPPQVDEARLQEHVKRLSIDFYPRSHDKFDNLDRAAKYIEAQFTAVGAAASLQAFKV